MEHLITFFLAMPALAFVAEITASIIEERKWTKQLREMA